jgi:hypothetical protein
MIEDIKNSLTTSGYCIIPNILSREEIDYAKQLFYDWQQTIPNHDKLHNIIDPHGIYKFHEAGHQRHAWYLRTRPQIIDIYKQLWNTDDLIVSFDGSCYIPKNLSKKDTIWTHTDQAPNSKEFKCYQGFVSLTDNVERTLIVYEGSHLLHNTYFEERNIKSSKNWHKIDPLYLSDLVDSKRVLDVPAGSLVLWDSRTFHQNQYGLPDSEERIVQYVCYFPRNHEKNTKAIQKKREKYFNEKRTTTHWPCPVAVNGLQPQTYGDKSKQIDYSSLQPIHLEDMMVEIQKLI